MFSISGFIWLENIKIFLFITDIFLSHFPTIPDQFNSSRSENGETKTKFINDKTEFEIYKMAYMCSERHFWLYRKIYSRISF